MDRFHAATLGSYVDLAIINLQHNLDVHKPRQRTGKLADSTTRYQVVEIIDCQIQLALLQNVLHLGNCVINRSAVCNHLGGFNDLKGHAAVS